MTTIDDRHDTFLEILGITGDSSRDNLAAARDARQAEIDRLDGVTASESPAAEMLALRARAADAERQVRMLGGPLCWTDTTQPALVATPCKKSRDHSGEHEAAPTHRGVGRTR